MATNQEIKAKWAEVLDYAREHATGKGLHIGYKWLHDAFEEYLDMSEEVGGYNMGGQKGSEHNRIVLAGKIGRAMRYSYDKEYGKVRIDLNDEQIDKLTDTLQWIVEHPKNNQSIKY